MPSFYHERRAFTMPSFFRALGDLEMRSIDSFLFFPVY